MANVGSMRALAGQIAAIVQGGDDDDLDPPGVGKASVKAPRMFRRRLSYRHTSDTVSATVVAEQPVGSFDVDATIVRASIIARAAVSSNTISYKTVDVVVNTSTDGTPAYTLLARLSTATTALVAQQETELTLQSTVAVAAGQTVHVRTTSSGNSVILPAALISAEFEED